MSNDAKKITTQDIMRVCIRRIRIWESEKSKPANCPLCEAPGMSIVDQSSRPYSEWYHVSCSHCGLDDKIHIASAARQT